MAVHDLFEGLETRVLKWIGALIIASVALLALHELYKNGTLSFLPSKSSDGFLLFICANLLDDVGGSLLVAGIIGIFFEVALRKGMLQDIAFIVERLRKPPLLRDYHLARNQLDSRMSTDIRSLQPGERIDLIGVSQRVVFADQPGIECIREKVAMGSEFRILVLHPASALVACIENLSKNYGFPNLKGSLRDTYEGRVKLLVDRLRQEPKRSGRLEIRMHRDINSTLSYHGSPRLKMLGLYLAHESGTHCPVLELEPGLASSQAERHFEALWKQSEHNVLAVVDSDRCAEYVAETFA